MVNVDFIFFARMFVLFANEILTHGLLFVCCTGRKFGYSVDGNQELMAIGKIKHISVNMLYLHCVFKKPNTYYIFK